MSAKVGGKAMSTPPGWYSDTSVQGQLRWWDGSVWTEHVTPLPAPQQADIGRTNLTTAPHGQSAVATAGMSLVRTVIGDRNHPKPWYKRKRVWAASCGLLMLIGALSNTEPTNRRPTAIASGASSTSAESLEPSTAATSTTTAIATTSAPVPTTGVSITIATAPAVPETPPAIPIAEPAVVLAAVETPAPLLLPTQPPAASPPKVAPAPVETAPPTTAVAMPRSVTPGAFCGGAGATGVSANGVPMTCATQKCDGTLYEQPRWRKSAC
jgi:Protein of unknown function (DUF2510)